MVVAYSNCQEWEWRRRVLKSDLDLLLLLDSTASVETCRVFVEATSTIMLALFAQLLLLVYNMLL